MLLRQACEAQQIRLSVAQQLGSRRPARFELLDDTRVLSPCELRIRFGEDHPHQRRDEPLCALRQQVAHEVRPTALPRSPRQRRRDRISEPGVRVRDRELHAAQCVFRPSRSPIPVEADQRWCRPGSSSEDMGDSCPVHIGDSLPDPASSVFLIHLLLDGAASPMRRQKRSLTSLAPST